jgi:hypothetical protein
MIHEWQDAKRMTVEFVKVSQRKTINEEGEGYGRELDLE